MWRESASNPAGVTVRGNRGSQRSLETRLTCRSYCRIQFAPVGNVIARNEGELVEGSQKSRRYCRGSVESTTVEVHGSTTKNN